MRNRSLAPPRAFRHPTPPQLTARARHKRWTRAGVDLGRAAFRHRCEGYIGGGSSAALAGARTPESKHRRGSLTPPRSSGDATGATDTDPSKPASERPGTDGSPDSTQGLRPHASPDEPSFRTWPSPGGVHARPAQAPGAPVIGPSTAVAAAGALLARGRPFRSLMEGVAAWQK
jgi:hypothetical protein